MTTEELRDYLKRRIESLGESPTSFSERLGWSPSYLTNALSGQFTPSEKRCRILAREFGDDPDLILSLAGYLVFQRNEDQESAELVSRYKSLRPRSQRLVSLFIDFMKYAEDAKLDLPAV